jgi:histidinol-phosphate aminotransferase
MLKPRTCIENLHPYHSPIISRDGLALDLNENALGCSPRVLARLQTLSAEEVARYPKREVGEQVEADFLGISPEQVLLANGMDDALAQLFGAYLGAGDELIFADPTFVMYPMLGAACGATIVRLQSAEDLALPVADFLKRISPRTRVIAIANPNNPTGLTARPGDLLQIVEAAPEAAVLIDEAYFEFGGETLIGELGHHSNLFVARTFSKAYGLAGLRLGVLTGAAEQIEYIRRLCPPFNVNSAVLACLEEALADQSFVRESVEQAKRACREIESLCAELQLRFWPSSTNFVLVRA